VDASVEDRLRGLEQLVKAKDDIINLLMSQMKAQVFGPCALYSLNAPVVLRASPFVACGVDVGWFASASSQGELTAQTAETSGAQCSAASEIFVPTVEAKLSEVRPNVSEAAVAAAAEAAAGLVAEARLFQEQTAATAAAAATTAAAAATEATTATGATAVPAKAAVVITIDCYCVFECSCHVGVGHTT